ncbi:MAG: transposase, partial [Candidatus Lokiarchaeota archaeon]|nr:transposase [Candidatus Lokiarchaeota archaeon]
RFIQFLTYKAEKIGKRVIKIDESATTQVCCQCGRKKNVLFMNELLFALVEIILTEISIQQSILWSNFFYVKKKRSMISYRINPL